MTDSAIKYSFAGHKGKIAFKTNYLTDLITRSVKLADKTKMATTKEVERAVCFNLAIESSRQIEKDQRKRKLNTKLKKSFCYNYYYSIQYMICSLNMCKLLLKHLQVCIYSNTFKNIFFKCS